ncbi:hypothetical protein [Paeniglutamicibacter kerguelensis]|uniref:DUF222 domain-containing protein n=1 Tax=Paeniglutamicibacter kerguelensis TaxID=254788 RepID=A0ABS4XIW2_9MICC|nr:hypothetical protein [Paeniglutamicibacter kerguelensis]MBP2388397.1 hypothetical protein [Paeniglutamicibacter kerguelensis]
MMEQEETEIVQDLGRTARLILGSGMQAAEQAQRRSHMEGQERLAQEQRAHAALLADGARERAMVEQIRRDFSSSPFWKNAGSESIADRMTVAAELAARHPEAGRTYMDGADRIRNQFGINVEDINRDHPTAPADRHAALRDALDDYFASHRLDAESDETPDADHDQDMAAAKVAQATQPGERAEVERVEEAAHLNLAGDAGAEVARDQKNAQGQEATEASRPEKTEGQWNPGEPTPGAAQALSSWREKTGGKSNPNFPDEPSLTNSNTAMKNRKRVIGAAQPNRTQEKVLIR